MEFFSRRNPAKRHANILSSKADEGRDYAQKKARELRERAEDLIERSKEIMSRQKDAISTAVDAGKETYKREAKAS